LSGNAAYGVSRPDVCNVFPGRPGCPNVGFGYALDTSKLSAGAHIIRVVATDSDTVADSAFVDVPVTVSTAPPPPVVCVDAPSYGSLITGTVNIIGWAIDSTTGPGTAINKVAVYVDGTLAGNATYGTSRPDVCNAFPGRPGCPNVGFTYPLDTRTLAAGTHRIRVIATDSDTSPDSALAEVPVTVY
jgi:Bacterial Ig domain